MSLLNSASLVVTPNGYKAGTLYSVIPNTTLGDMTVVRATTATRVNSAGLIESVANNVPRLDYLNGTCPSLLVEPQRTNVLTYSEQFATSWVNNGATIISNDTTAPDGNLTADRLTATGGGFGVVKFSTWTATNNVASCFVKANTSNLFRISNVSGGGGSVTFNLSTQAITATTGFTGSIESLPDGWFRCIAIDTLARSGTFSIGVTAIGESVFVWGAQLEAGSYPTSYIPTVASAVTRNADQVYKQGISSLIGQTEGTLFFDGIVNNIQNAYSNILNTNKITSLSTIQLAKKESDNKFRFDQFLGDGTFSRITLNSTNAFANGARTKIAIRYKSGSFAMYINGNLEATSSSSFTNIGTKTELFLNDAVTYFNYQESVSFNSVVLFTSGLTNEQLATLTTM